MNEPVHPAKVKFDYIKSNFFRTAKANGAVCGANGFGDVILNFFSERSPIPQRTVHNLSDGRLGDEIAEERVGRDAVVREVEVSISMNIQVARSIVTALDQQIKILEDQLKQQKPLEAK